MRWEAAEVRGAERRWVSFDLVDEALRQVEGGDGGGVRKAWLGEGLRCRLLVAQEASRVRVIGREVGLGHRELLKGRVDNADTETVG